MVWFRVGCCERCGGVASRGERGSLGPKLQGSHGTGQHPQHCQHHPQDADDAGEWGDHTIGGGGGVRGPGTGTYIHRHVCSHPVSRLSAWRVSALTERWAVSTGTGLSN